MSKAVNVKVTSRECKGDVYRMIRKFIKKTKRERIVEQVRENKYYDKPSVQKKEKRRKAERMRKREERKRLRAKERRNRKK